MRKIEWKKRIIGFRLYKHGLYFHIRNGDSFRHFKIGVWKQKNLRVSTRKQVRHFGLAPAYCNAIRIGCSYWWSKSGGRQKHKRGFGLMFYWPDRRG